MSDVTTYFLFLVFVYALGSLQFGYHIGELNTPQKVISCQSGDIGVTVAGFVKCISMTDIQYGTVVSMFPVGGLVGSLAAGRLADQYGRKRLSLTNSILFIIGPLIMATANQIWTLGLGRFLCGISSGVSMVSVPIYLNEISPIAIRGTVGVMTQLSCVVGILLAQIAGVYLSSVPQWRYILAIGSLLAVVQFIALWATVESPKWLASQPGQHAQAKALLISIRGRSDIEAEMKSWKITDEDLESERRVLFNGSEDSPLAAEKLSIRTFLTSAKYRPAVGEVLLTQLAVGPSTCIELKHD